MENLPLALIQLLNPAVAVMEHSTQAAMLSEGNQWHIVGCGGQIQAIGCSRGTALKHMATACHESARGSTIYILSCVLCNVARQQVVWI